MYFYKSELSIVINLIKRLSTARRVSHVPTNFYDITAKILPVVKRQHLLLCTLLMCDAAAMEVNYYINKSF